MYLRPVASVTDVQPAIMSLVVHMIHPIRIFQIAGLLWLVGTSLWLLMVVGYINSRREIISTNNLQDLDTAALILQTIHTLESRESHSLKEYVQQIFLDNDDLFMAKLDHDKENVNRSKQPVEHIAFLKVHKAASTTVQNIFLRFGWKHNLTFVLPPNEPLFRFPNIISLTESLTEANIAPAQNGKYDILCNHVIYDKDAFQKILPNDTVYIGIVRNPLEQFASIVNYMKPDYIFNNSGKVIEISEFLRNPWQYEPDGPPSNSWTNNRMAVEFGLPHTLFNHYNSSSVTKYLDKLNREFNLVLIAELLDESIVLMRRLLNWETKDVVYLSQNVLRLSAVKLTSFDRWFHKRYAKLDYDLYRFFYKRLRKQIRQQGSDFVDELVVFRETLLQIKEYCSQKEDASPLHFQATPWGGSFVVSMKDCLLMLRPEIDFLDQIRKKQNGWKTAS